jgi:ferredoxin-nitrite reductase
MSFKRVAESVHSGMSIPADRESVVTFCGAILRIFRDESERKDQQKARLMWLVEKYGVEGSNEAIKNVESYHRGVKVYDEQPKPTGPFERRELMGVRVGSIVPAGRLRKTECRELADLADKYTDGEIRFTVEQNLILPNVDFDKVDAL